MRTNLKRAVVGGMALLATTAFTPFMAMSAMAADPGTPSAGPLTMTPSSGDSTTQFVLKPTMADNPNAAFCQGDSATGNYRWQMFITPRTVDPATLTYNSDGPVPQAGEATYALYDNGGTPVVNKNTGIGDGLVLASGQPASFNVFPDDLIPDGDYWVGVACTLFGTTTRYWAVPVTLSPGTSPYNYALDEGPDPVVPEAPLSVLLPLTGLAAGAGFVVLRRRRQEPTTLAA